MHVKSGKGFSRSLELSHILHRLCEPPSIPLSFSLATILPRRSKTFATLEKENLPRTSAQCLRLGLPGYLIPFATLAFALERQLKPSKPLSPPVFLAISKHFTAPPQVPLAPTSL